MLKKANPECKRWDHPHRLDMICQRNANADVTGEKFKGPPLKVNKWVQENLMFPKSELWKGPIALIARSWTGNKYQDVSTADFRVLCDILGVYDDSFKLKTLVMGIPLDKKAKKVGNFVHGVRNRGTPMSGMVQGVKAYCVADEQFLYAPKYVPQEFPRQHWVWKEDMSPPIMTRLGIPIRIVRAAEENGVRWEEEADGLLRGVDFNSCLAAKTLTMIDVTTDAEFLYTMPKFSDQNAGTCMFAREDHKPLSVYHLESLVQFFVEYINPLAAEFRQEMADLESTGTLSHKNLFRLRNAFLEEHITKEKFETWFVDFKKKKALSSRAWDDVESPFSI